MAAHGTELGEVPNKVRDKMADSGLPYHGIIISNYTEPNCRIIGKSLFGEHFEGCCDLIEVKFIPVIGREGP
jgi:hypothetical protein